MLERSQHCRQINVHSLTCSISAVSRLRRVISAESLAYLTGKHLHIFWICEQVCHRIQFVPTETVCKVCKVPHPNEVVLRRIFAAISVAVNVINNLIQNVSARYISLVITLVVRFAVIEYPIKHFFCLGHSVDYNRRFTDSFLFGSEVCIQLSFPGCFI